MYRSVITRASNTARLSLSKSCITKRLASTVSTEANPEPMNATQKAELGLNDERLIGNYPRVPLEYHQHRDQYVTYDDQLHRRNFNEPLHEYFDSIDVWSPDRFDQVSDNVALKNTSVTIGLFAAFSALVYMFSTHDEKPAAPREYPHEGLYKALGGDEETKEIYQARQDPKY